MSKKFFFLLAIVIFYFLFILFSDFTKFSESFSTIQYEFLPLLLFGTFVGMLIKGIRQHVMLKKLNVSLPIKNSILLYLAGSSMTLTPGGSGSIIKSYFLKKRYGIKISDTFSLVFLERFHDLLAVTCMITVTLFLIPQIEISILVLVVFSFLSVGFVSMRSKIFFSFVTKILTKLPKINSFVDDVTNSYNGFNSLTRSKITLQNWLLSMVAWGIDAIIIYLVFLSFNLDVNIIFTTLTMHSSFLLGNVSIIPAGLGITELSAVTLLIQEGIQLSVATSIVIIIRLVTTWFATVVGLITTHIYLKQK